MVRLSRLWSALIIGTLLLYVLWYVATAQRVWMSWGARGHQYFAIPEYYPNKRWTDLLFSPVHYLDAELVRPQYWQEERFVLPNGEREYVPRGLAEHIHLNDPGGLRMLREQE